MKYARRNHTLARIAAPLAILAALAVSACGDGSPGATGSSGASGASGSQDGAPAAASTETGGADGVTSPDAAAIAASYDEGLDFLLKSQDAGKWSVQGQPSVGYTAMCVTNLLDRPGGARDADRAVIDSGLAFLAASLTADGGVDGAYRPNYETSVVIMALAASGRDEYRPVIDRAAKFIYKLQRMDDANPTVGGIGYGSDDTRSDLSNTQYALASLRAAGIPEDDPVYQRALVFLQRTQNRTENETSGEPTEWIDKETGKKLVRGDDGGANYFPGNSKGGFDERPDGVGVLRSYGSMTYALLRCYHFAGLGLDDGRVKAAVDWIAKNWTLDHNPGLSGDDRQSGLFYMYATLGKALSLAGIDTLDVPGGNAVDWRAELSARLVSTQREDGSWINDASERWMEGDPILATSYALNALSTTPR